MLNGKDRTAKCDRPQFCSCILFFTFLLSLVFPFLILLWYFANTYQVKSWSVCFSSSLSFFGTCLAKSAGSLMGIYYIATWKLEDTGSVWIILLSTDRISIKDRFGSASWFSIKLYFINYCPFTSYAGILQGNVISLLLFVFQTLLRNLVMVI